MKGLLQLNKPTAGKIVTGDGLKPDQIGYLPQQTGIQRDFPASVYEVVLSGCLNKMGRRLFYSRENKKTAMDSMASLGITSLKNECYREADIKACAHFGCYSATAVTALTAENTDNYSDRKSVV